SLEPTIPSMAKTCCPASAVAWATSSDAPGSPLSLKKKQSPRLTAEGPAPRGKIEGPRPREPRGDTPLLAIVKVRRDGYVPPGVTVRARLGPTLFTAELPAATLAPLEADPLVESIAPAQRLKSS